MAIHTLPTVSALINLWLLSDTPLYISDSWTFLIIGLPYMTLNYWFYHTNGWNYYKSLGLDWSKQNKWSIAASITVFYSVAITAQNIILALLSQTLLGRYEWEADWLQSIKSSNF